MKSIQEYSSIFLAIYVAIVLLIVPQLNNPELMDSTQSSKAFGFLWGMLGYTVMIIIINAVNHKPIHIKITLIDILLGAFCLLEAISYWRNPGDQLKMLTFGGLIIFYLSVRALDLKYIHYLLIAIIISGAVQAIYGNVQLWGYYPSNHGIFNMTGSFFNPGPYAGYLATVFPVSLGMYLFGIPSEYKKSNIVLLKMHNHYSILKSILRQKISKTLFIYNNSFSKSTTGKQEKEPTQTKYDLLKSIALISVITMCLVLPASRSRAAWLAVLVSSFYLISIKYQLTQRVKIYFDTNAKKLFLVVMLAFLVAISGAGLYFFKRGSADGRLLIWKVTTNIVKDYPIWGVGQNMLPAYYMKYQAEYFQRNQTSKLIMNAGDNRYAFNEFLNIWAENGLIGLILFILILYFIFRKRNNLIESEKKIFSPNTANKLKYEKIMQSSLLSSLIFSSFSYSGEILPLKMIVVANLGMLALLKLEKQEEISLGKILFLNRIRFLNRNNEHKDYLIHSQKSYIPPSINQPGNNQICGYIFKLLNSSLTATIIIISIIMIPKLTEMKAAYVLWKDAYDEYNSFLYKECLETYAQPWSELIDNGEYLLCYGKALYQAGEFDKSHYVLDRSTKYLNNSITYTALGDVYQKKNKNKQAEESYLLAHWMIPSQFYPEYLLAKHFRKLGNNEKATQYAKKIINKPIKVSSTAIDEMREEMFEILKHQELRRDDN